MDETKDLEQDTGIETPEATEHDETDVFADNANGDEDLGDFEFDEDGNIIVDGEEEPEDVSEAQELDEEDAEEDEEEDEDKEESPVEDATYNATTATKAPENKGHTNKNDADELKSIRTVVKDMLIKLGEENVKDDEILERVMKVAAESADLSLDEYKAQLEDKKIVEEARQAKQNSEAESVMAADLTILKASYTELRGIDHLSKMPNFKRFCELRASGNTAEEAYLATNGKAVRANMAKNVQKSSLAGTKNHLRATGGKASAKSNPGISKRELDMLREQFSGLSDKEIIRLYNRAKQ